MKQPILVSIPHGGWKVADEIKDIWNLNAHDAFHDGDPYTSRIYDFSDKVKFQIVMEYFRAVVDLNRQPDDIAPKNPDGVIKSKTCWNKTVYKPDLFPNDDLIEKLLNKYYYPYHKKLEEQSQNPSIRLIVDCHSMAAISPPIEDDAGNIRPLICLGNLGDENGEIEDEFKRITCDPDIINFMSDEFKIAFQHEDLDLSPSKIVTMNKPFNGGYITRSYGCHKIPLVQIEMNRALYLNKKTFDNKKLYVKENRIKDLNQKVWKVLANTVKNL